MEGLGISMALLGQLGKDPDINGKSFHIMLHELG